MCAKRGNINTYTHSTEQNLAESDDSAKHTHSVERMRASANKTAGCVCVYMYVCGRTGIICMFLWRRFCLRCARTRRALITYFADKAASKLGAAFSKDERR
jgi:hypothetical protein